MELTSQRTHAPLMMQPDNQTEAFLYDGAFRLIGAGFERGRHQLIVNHDISAHNVYNPWIYTHSQEITV